MLLEKFEFIPTENYAGFESTEQTLPLIMLTNHLF